MRKIFCLKDPGLEWNWIGIEVPGLVHEDSLVSIAGRGYSQPSSLFGKHEHFPINSVTSSAMVSITLEEVKTQFIYMVADLLWEKRGLHGIDRDQGDRSLNEGGPASHWKILGLPSFYALTNIIHQILIGVSSSTGGKNGCAKVGSYAVCGGEAKDFRHLIFYTPRGARREPGFRLSGAHELTGRLTEI